MQLRIRILTFRVELLLRRESRRRRRRLEAELASYRTPGELNDLYALLDTCPDPQTHEIRQILGHQQTQRMWRAGGAR
jgi:hypothetical protein